MFKYLRKFEKGQALSEYVATFPIAVAVGIVVGAAFGPSLTGVYQQVVDSFDAPAAECEPAPSATTLATPGGHEIEVVEHTVTDNQTTVTYRVKSTNNPSISHWTLAMSESAWNNVINKSELNAELPQWGTDPTTSVTGIKFDRGYETADAGGSDGGDAGGNNGNNGNNGNGNASTISMMSTRSNSLVFAPYYAPDAQLITDERTITMVFAGTYELAEEQVAIKAGNNSYTATVATPVLADGSSAATPTDCE